MLWTHQFTLRHRTTGEAEAEYFGGGISVASSNTKWSYALESTLFYFRANTGKV